MKVKLVSLTKSADQSLPLSPEELIVYTARVSSPKNQTDMDTAPKLLAYLIKHGHWSPFEMVDMTVEIVTSRAIAAQILRHDANFQEFSQRYSEVLEVEIYPARRQDNKNRQNSIDDLSQEVKDWWEESQYAVWAMCSERYKEALEKGIAKECARFLLPMATQTTLYMKNSIRNWIHYINTRTSPSAQKEHRDVAEAIKPIFMEHFPSTSEALGWKKCMRCNDNGSILVGEYKCETTVPCPDCKEILKSLSDEELAKVPTLSDNQIKQAFETGYQERDLAQMSSQSKQRRS